MWRRNPSQFELDSHPTVRRQIDSYLANRAPTSNSYTYIRLCCVRHLPLDHADGRWEKHRQERDERHAAAVASVASGVGTLSDREVLLLGAAIYWCEGAKGKP